MPGRGKEEDFDFYTVGVPKRISASFAEAIALIPNASIFKNVLPMPNQERIAWENELEDLGDLVAKARDFASESPNAANQAYQELMRRIDREISGETPMPILQILEIFENSVQAYKIDLENNAPLPYIASLNSYRPARDRLSPRSIRLAISYFGLAGEKTNITELEKSEGLKNIPQAIKTTTNQIYWFLSGRRVLFNPTEGKARG